MRNERGSICRGVLSVVIDKYIRLVGEREREREREGGGGGVGEGERERERETMNNRNIMLCYGSLNRWRMMI